jgi:endonuclease/exonuclease/phosphatase family metal-dependent hydrolase
VETIELEWTVLTWNLQGSKHTDIDAVARAIVAQRPDVVALQEVRRDQAVALARTLSMRFTWAFKHHPFSPFFIKRSEGAAILTPHALDAAAHTVISDELSKRSYKRRIAQWALVGRPDTSAYRIYNVHFSPHDAVEERRAEAERVSDLVVEHGDAPPAVVAGDLNAGPGEDVIGLLPGIEAIEVPPTNPSDAPTQHLDHVLVPPEARHVSVTVPGSSPEWSSLSDHLPVTVRFTLDWVRGDWPPGT